jgi:ABC-type uncharacterized transport system YnjBCD permease subunit
MVWTTLALGSILAMVAHLLLMERANGPNRTEKASVAVVSVLCPLVALVIGLTSGAAAMISACCFIPAVQYGAGRLILRNL